MKEEVLRLTNDHDLLDATCFECTRPFEVNDEVIICPRCKAIHHKDCWIEKGGCARHGCRQVMSLHLRPAKEEKPITVKKLPAWAKALIGLAVVALVIGVYFNSKKAAMIRESSGYVLISELENEATWRRAVESYNETAAGTTHPARLILTPYGPAGTYFDQKLFIMISAHDSPEFAVLEEERLSIYIEQNVLEPLEPQFFDVASSGISFDPDRLAAATADGRVYGIPHPMRPAYFVVPRSPRNQEASQQLFPFIVTFFYEELSPPKVE